MANRNVKVTSNLGRIASDAMRKAPLIVAKTSADIEAGAKMRAPVDTGLLRASIQDTPISPMEREVVVGAEYAPHVECGTHHPPRAIRTRDGMDVTEEYSIPARPFLIPAAEAARPGFERATRKLFES